MDLPRSDTSASVRAKRRFAKRAADFVKAALALPGMPLLPAITMAAGLVAALAGAFTTGEMPLPQRLAFWMILMTWQSIKWTALFAMLVRQPEDYWKAALIGTVVLTPWLPAEVWLTYRLIGRAPDFAIAAVLWPAAVIAAAVLGLMALVNPPWRWRERTLPASGLLASRGISPADVLAASAEDHYCRVYLADARQVLLLGRFADLLVDLAQSEGMQIHRGHWVSDRAVQSCRRAGGGWEVLLPCGTAMRVSATYRAQAKARGWLRPRAAPTE